VEDEDATRGRGKERQRTFISTSWLAMMRHTRAPRSFHIARAASSASTSFFRLFAGASPSPPFCAPVPVPPRASARHRFSKA
jgi:hypothetical protein